MNKISFVLGGILGYVLGARAGHERYEQIRDAGKQVWENPRVQESRTKVQQTVREQAPVLKEKAAAGARQAGETAQAKATEAVSKVKDGVSSEQTLPEPPRH